MHQHTLKRLAKLEAASGLRQQTDGCVNRIWFAGQEAEAVRAEGPNGFISHREPDESFDTFECRACHEVLALMPPRGAHPPPILIFMGPR
jgi:hypothetical protein